MTYVQAAVIRYKWRLAILQSWRLRRLQIQNLNHEEHKEHKVFLEYAFLRVFVLSVVIKDEIREPQSLSVPQGHYSK
ncbi:hypothetical protein GV64_15990 [Endozoicomonas elysicola]|uniref:Uncharacterized protein n=1 Tax=Endozoicomonas elysicola TaxID=305900 RepID=A0A081KCZ7_9GAMM|nr:hypothetical protein GV64_15990 [Endozoicomonas elysicola]